MGLGAGRSMGTGSRQFAINAGQPACPFFFKQWGGVHKTKAGRSLDGQTYDEVPDRRSRVADGS